MTKTVFRFSAVCLWAVLLAACGTAPSRSSSAKGPAKTAAKQAQRNVRLLLADGRKLVPVKHSGTVYIYTQDKSRKFKISNPGTLNVKALGGGKLRVGTLDAAQTVILEPAPGTLLTFETNAYSGKFYLIPSGNTFALVEHTGLEDYLYGVLPYEMSYRWPAEALKAQAVAARTYTLIELERPKNKNFDLYSDVRSQMYKGSGKQFDSVKKAVDETRGEVLKYQGKLFHTFYHGNCGGGTDDVKSWNPGAQSIKPLSGSKCKYDSHSANYEWTQKVPRAKLDAYAKSLGIAGKLKSIKITRRTDTKRATNLDVKTAKGTKNVPCGKFRAATGIKSCKITKISIGGKEVTFKGRGSGHGVGMCQDGANGMAKAGKNYKQILKNYYPGSELTR